MKKIFKKIKLRDLIFFIIGGVIFGSVGVFATTYVLQANEIEYKNNKSVQEAIEELYTMAQNSGSGEPLFKLSANGAPTANQNQIVVNFNKIEPSTPTITCKATSPNGIVITGTVSGNTCTFAGLLPNTNYTYEVVRTDQNGTTNSITGNKTTTASGAMLVTDNKPVGTLGIAYLDPTDLSNVCNASNSTVGSGTSGCMKWYAFKEDTNSYTMILDHNTYAKGTWENTKTQLASLQQQTGWKDLNTRMITGEEVADITGNTSWTSTGSYFYFDTNTTTRTKEGKYYWLFDYTYGCTSYGCKVADSSIYGYWTSTPKSSSLAWGVDYDGSLYNYSVSDTNRGLRPVITVSKSNL